VSGSREPRADHELGPIVKQGSLDGRAGSANSNTTGRIWLWCGGRRLSALAAVRLRASRCDETDSRGSSVVAHARHERRLVRKGEFEPPRSCEGQPPQAWEGPWPPRRGRPQGGPGEIRMLWWRTAHFRSRALMSTYAASTSWASAAESTFTTRPQLHVAPALACSLQPADSVSRSPEFQRMNRDPGGSAFSLPPGATSGGIVQCGEPIPLGPVSSCSSSRASLRPTRPLCGPKRELCTRCRHAQRSRRAQRAQQAA
jgi:hypothetical protein